MNRRDSRRFYENAYYHILTSRNNESNKQIRLKVL